MALYAKVVEGIVDTVIVADSDFISNQPGTWIETFEDGSSRKNYAGKGYTYDEIRDAFISPKPFNSWLLDEVTCRWKAPSPYPNDGNRYHWDENTLAWVGS